MAFHKYYIIDELVQLVLILLPKIKSQHTEVDDGSNESLDHADEELDTHAWTLLRKYSSAQ